MSGGGKGKLDIDESLSPYFDIRGRLSYPDMFRAMEEADFFLCLLDPDNPEHERYVTVGTSGSFQLIYGFEKPCLIHKHFADVYDFNSGNSLVYADNRDLSRLMQRAVKMKPDEYKRIQQGIKKKATKIRSRSLTNFERLLSKKEMPDNAVHGMITVIIPAYNASDYIEKCLKTVLGQTYKNLEVLVIDDCSTDDTAAKVAAIKDPRLKLVSLRKNSGQSYARNIGIKASQGEFVGFVDADDYLEEDFYEKLYKKVIKTGADVTIANTKMVRLDGTVSHTSLRRRTVFSFFDKFSLLPHGGTWDKLYRTSFLRKNKLFFMEGRIWEDNLYNLQVVYYANRLSVADGTYYYYIKNDSSTTRSPQKIRKRKQDCLYIVEAMLAFMKKHKFLRHERDLVINFILSHMATTELREDKNVRDQLLKQLGRLEKIVPEKAHRFRFSLRKKQLCVLGKYWWNGKENGEKNV